MKQGQKIPTILWLYWHTYNQLQSIRWGFAVPDQRENLDQARPPEVQKADSADDILSFLHHSQVMPGMRMDVYLFLIGWDEYFLVYHGNSQAGISYLNLYSFDEVECI